MLMIFIYLGNNSAHQRSIEHRVWVKLFYVVELDRIQGYSKIFYILLEFLDLLIICILHLQKRIMQEKNIH